MPNMKVYSVDFTNWSFYCHTKNSIDHIVFIHNVKLHQFKIVHSMAMSLNIEVFDSVECLKLLTRSQQQFAK